ncbi:MAG TPA: type II secretion system protein GspM [Hyphomicrobiaceae bacterium]|nr:type II secretion system protein GspM [Hyphomicrobiaceae bacterium]
MTRLSRATRRMAAVALLALLIAFAALTTVVPLAARVAELRDQIEIERALRGRLAAVAAHKVKTAEYEQVGRAALESGAYLKGDSEALMAAGLQTSLAQLAAATRVRFNSTRALPPRERDAMRLIGVSLQFRADIEQLRALLFRIESHRPFLFVEGLQVRPVSPFSRGDTKLNGLLDVRLDAFGVVPGKTEPARR